MKVRCGRVSQPVMAPASRLTYGMPGVPGRANLSAFVYIWTMYAYGDRAVLLAYVDNTHHLP